MAVREGSRRHRGAVYRARVARWGDIRGLVGRVGVMEPMPKSGGVGADKRRERR
nr:hypothetical protein KitaXyl93_33190 [Kitasatospora sp. Xyl93]